MNERIVSVIEFKTHEVQSDNDQVQTRTIVNDVLGMPRWKENTIDIFTIVETEILPTLRSQSREMIKEFRDTAKDILNDQGFIRNKDAEYGRNSGDEVWEKATHYAADNEAINLAKIVLHDQIQSMKSEIEALRYSVNNAEHKFDVSNQTIKSLQSKIKTATLYQRVKFLFGGEL